MNTDLETLINNLRREAEDSRTPYSDKVMEAQEIVLSEIRKVESQLVTKTEECEKQERELISLRHQFKSAVTAAKILISKNRQDSVLIVERR